MPKAFAEKPVFLRPRSKFWQIRYTEPNGSEVRFSSKTTNYEEACALYQSLVGHVDALSVDSLVSRFFREHQVRPSTLRCYRISYNHWRPIIGHLRASNVRRSHVQELVSRRLGAVQASSIRNDLAMMSSFMEWAAMLPGGPETNVVAEFSKKRLKPAQPRIRFLEADQKAALLRELTEPFQRLIASFAMEAGLRKGEILSLKVRQADPRRRTIVLGDNTKTGKGRRVPMTNRLTQEIISWWRANPHLRPGDWLFSNPETFKPYTEVRWFNRACERAGIESFHFHDLRHHFASDFVQSGGRLQPLAALLGHSTVAMSEKYAHLASDTAAAEFKRLMRERNRR